MKASTLLLGAACAVAISIACAAEGSDPLAPVGAAAATAAAACPAGN